ncbi:hypothetical protein CLOM_g2122 [Closterium sp. NIES-68]|nr:hypothetical protein CLOM_g2122 [Closterium sp. NIES-68]GJP70833.1 hypothetical protein CLOP_g1728 [Closterium sp. NIES-67]
MAAMTSLGNVAAKLPSTAFIGQRLRSTTGPACQVTLGRPASLAVRAEAAEGERKKTGLELREEFFLAAATGKERGLPEGAFLNDNVVDGPLVDITWEPYGDTCSAPEGSNLLKAAVDAGALTIDNRFCLTGQCDVCIIEIDGEVMRSCMKPVPTGQKNITCLVLDTDDAWEEMMV